MIYCYFDWVSVFSLNNMFTIIVLRKLKLKRGWYSIQLVIKIFEYLYILKKHTCINVLLGHIIIKKNYTIVFSLI